MKQQKFKEFSKQLLIVDYIVMLGLILFSCYCYLHGMDIYNLTIICSTWIGQLAISSGAYYWKSKSENKIKLPMKLIETLPDDIKKDIDMTQIITTILNQ